MYHQIFTQRFFMVNWIPIHYFFVNISSKLFSKKTIFTIFNSVSYPKLSYKNSLLFIFLSCCVGNTYCEELAQDYKANIQKFDENKQKELDSLHNFYEQQLNSVAHKVRDGPPPMSEQQSFISKLYDFVTEHYLISSFLALILAFVFFRAIFNTLLFVLSIFKERLNKIFNSFPKPIQRVLHKERRRFQKELDDIMRNRDRIL